MEFGEYGPRCSGQGEAAIEVASPFDGELRYLVTRFCGTEDDLDVEHESVSDASCVEFSGDVTVVYFESALGVGEVAWYSQPSVDEPFECFGAESSHERLALLDVAVDHFSGPVCDVADAISDHV